MHILNDEKERNLELKGEGLLLVKETLYKKMKWGKSCNVLQIWQLENGHTNC